MPPRPQRLPRWLTESWEVFGRSDPLWAILTHPGKRRGGWDRDEFFATGTADVAGLLDRAATLLPGLRRGRALDFGCGVGRLTQALAERFEGVVGVDVATSMIRQAEAWNRHGGRCQYVVCTAPDLAPLRSGSFDLVLSKLVLQHMPPVLASAYVEELARLVSPGGLLVLQLPSEPRRRGPGRFRVTRPIGRAVAGLRRLRNLLLRRALLRLPVMEMYGVPRPAVEHRLHEAGLSLLAVDEDGAAGPAWTSLCYWATRRT